MEHEPLPPETVVHRLGGGSVANLRLKPQEMTLLPPGISVLLGGSPEQVRGQVRRAFPYATRLLDCARTVGTTTVTAIRAAGFDVVPAPTRHFPNHARMVHRDGIQGFTDAALRELSHAFTNTRGT